MTDFNPILCVDEMKVYYARHTKDMRVVQSDGTVVFYILEKYTLGICKTLKCKKIIKSTVRIVVDLKWFIFDPSPILKLGKVKKDCNI